MNTPLREIGKSIALGCCLSLVAVSALAQEPIRRPFRRIFGTQERPGQVQRLDLRLSGALTYDDSLLADRLPGPTPIQSGTFPYGVADLTYYRHVGRGSLNLNAASSAQYVPKLENRLDRSHSAGLDFTLPVGRNTIRVAQSASYATFASLLGLPGGAIADPGATLPGSQLLSPGESYGVSRSGGWQANTHATFARQFGRRSSLEGRYSLARTDLAELLSTFNSAGFNYGFNLTRQAAVRAGYSYQRGQSEGRADVIFHNVDVGVDYSRRLPGLRNTTLALSSGSAVIDTPEGRELTVLGDVRVVHLMGRTWTSGLGYHRGLEYAGVLGQLISGDSITATLTGLASPRLEVWISSSYSRGNMGTIDAATVISEATIVRVQYALSRRLAFDTEYINYYHSFGARAVLPGSVPPRLSRNAVRAGLTLLLPLGR
jgi:hypothetical protein